MALYRLPGLFSYHVHGGAQAYFGKRGNSSSVCSLRSKWRSARSSGWTIRADAGPSASFRNFWSRLSFSFGMGTGAEAHSGKTLECAGLGGAALAERVFRPRAAVGGILRGKVAIRSRESGPGWSGPKQGGMALSRRDSSPQRRRSVNARQRRRGRRRYSRQQVEWYAELRRAD